MTIENLMGLNKKAPEEPEIYITQEQLLDQLGICQRALAEAHRKIYAQRMRLNDLVLVEDKLETAVAAARVYREATLVSHDAHWRSGGRGGICPACAWIDSVRDKADKLMEDL
jgi:hypothetical protein